MLQSLVIRWWNTWIVGKLLDPVQLKLKAIRVQQLKTLLITQDQLPEKKAKMVIHSGTNDVYK